MTILVNDQPREIASGLTVEELVRDLGLAGRKGIAIAINDEVVPRASWTTRRLASGERVLVIRATQGG
ncbi:MAG: sulfur carrier protein ThiS [Opitutaceae bacterium]|jgi:sulfur carrier protein|nr:sulfur carrier protein ThiS [Opitutaceae bacterium]